MNKKIQGVGHVFYIESCPLENIIEHILPFYNVALSPLHCWDKNQKGEIKKAHYHLLFQGNLTEKDKRYISKITGMKYFEPIYDLVNAYGYLYHFNIRKHEWINGKSAYWKCDILYGEQWNDISLSSDNVDSVDIVSDVIKLISDFTEFSSLVLYLSSDPIYRPMLNYVLANHGWVDKFIRSNRYSIIDNKKKIDRDTENFEDVALVHTGTGEVICDLYTFNQFRANDIDNIIENNINIDLTIE